MGGNAGNHFRNDKARVQKRSDGERWPKTRRYMAMGVAMVMMLAMVVIMGMMGVLVRHRQFRFPQTLSFAREGAWLSVIRKEFIMPGNVTERTPERGTYSRLVSEESVRPR